MRAINLIVVHCAATKPSMDIGAAEIRAWHTDPKRPGGAWADIGYHYVIRRNGRLEHGRPVEIAGAHAAGYNARSVGICLVGGLDAQGKPADEFEPIQKETMRNVIEWLRERYPKTRIVGHRDLPDVKKACPSFDVARWCRSVGINPEMPT
jgi:N-acetylmuramoyl-L-alanine amidase